MSSYLKNEIVLIKYPFSDLSTFKVRPAVVISGDSISHDLFIVPLTSRVSNLIAGEFILSNWNDAGLNIQSSVKRGIFTIDEKLVIQRVGKLQSNDIVELEKSIFYWLGY